MGSRSALCWFMGGMRSGVPGVPERGSTCTTAHSEPNPGAVYHFARHTCPGVTRLRNPSRCAHFDTSATLRPTGTRDSRRSRGGSTCKSAHFDADGRAHATFPMSYMRSATRLGIFGRDARFDRSGRSVGPGDLTSVPVRPPLPQPNARPPASPSRAAPSRHRHLVRRYTAPPAYNPRGRAPNHIRPGRARSESPRRGP
jgi:hypothetical protein